VLQIRLSHVRPDTESVMRGHGMPRKDGTRGSLIVHFTIRFPTLSAPDKAKMKEILSGYASY